MKKTSGRTAEPFPNDRVRCGSTKALRPDFCVQGFLSRVWSAHYYTVLLGVACGLFLAGCDLIGVQGGDWQQTSFRIGEGVWTTSVPATWEIQEPDPSTNIIFASQWQDINFVILQRPGSVDDNASIRRMYDAAAAELFYFYELSFDPGAWVFQAKDAPSNPIRQYHQKVMDIPGTDYFLLGSCSFDTTMRETFDCESLLDSWQRVDKES